MLDSIPSRPLVTRGALATQAGVSESYYLYGIFIFPVPPPTFINVGMRVTGRISCARLPFIAFFIL